MNDSKLPTLLIVYHSTTGATAQMAQAALRGAGRATAEKKRRRAHRKFGMDEGFPFTSKWQLPKLLAEIRGEVADEDMPPPSYMKTKGVTMTEAERQAIIDWAQAQ